MERADVAAGKKKAEELNIPLVFIDESGFSLNPSVTRTWAPRGQTPILRCAGTWTKVSAISALVVSADMHRTSLFFRFHANKNVRAPEVVTFLWYLHQKFSRGFMVLWDHSRSHQGKLVMRFLERHPQVHMNLFPGYAPELNPDEFVWTHLKRSVANSVPKDVEELQHLIGNPIRHLQRSERLLRSCVRASDLPWS